MGGPGPKPDDTNVDSDSGPGTKPDDTETDTASSEVEST
ncbi:hypothetical protein A2U01_0099696 [Trifolium medium]|uniref:Uncharacterized protein n=1 Tax=Trifolium medium TaxID=97028 RepID=A0A392UR24_9FABA|nr:hypothetical protein [Trifolium medium]